MLCPICRKPAAKRGKNASYPFCSDRCRLVDLGRWLGEAYRLPGERVAPPIGHRDPGEGSAQGG